MHLTFVNESRMLHETRVMRDITVDLTTQGFEMFAHGLARSFEASDLVTVVERVLGKVSYIDTLLERHIPDYIAAVRVLRDLRHAGYVDESAELLDAFNESDLTGMVSALYELDITDAHTICAIRDALKKHVPAENFINGLLELNGASAPTPQRLAA